MKKKVRRQKRIVNIAIILPLLLAGIGMAFGNGYDFIPATVVKWGSVVYSVFVAVIAGIVDRCPFCKKYLGFRHT